jgi:Na+/phosphate symporter
VSGGHFDYNQFNIESVADEIDSLVEKNAAGQYQFSDETIEKFRQAEKLVRRAAAMVQRIDWLVSDDDGEDTFHARWKEDMAALERKSQ